MPYGVIEGDKIDGDSSERVIAIDVDGVEFSGCQLSQCLFGYRPQDTRLSPANAVRSIASEKILSNSSSGTFASLFKRALRTWWGCLRSQT